MDGKIKYSAGGIQLHKAEVDRLTEMDQWWKKTTGESHVPGARTQLGSSPAGAASKMCLLGDTRDFQFFDAVFKVCQLLQVSLTTRYCISILEDRRCTMNSTSQTVRSRLYPFAISTTSAIHIHLQALSTASTSRTHLPITSCHVMRLGTPFEWETSGPKCSKVNWNLSGPISSPKVRQVKGGDREDLPSYPRTILDTSQLKSELHHTPKLNADKTDV